MILGGAAVVVVLTFVLPFPHDIRFDDPDRVGTAVFWLLLMGGCATFGALVALSKPGKNGARVKARASEEKAALLVDAILPNFVKPGTLLAPEEKAAVLNEIFLPENKRLSNEAVRRAVANRLAEMRRPATMKEHIKPEIGDARPEAGGSAAYTVPSGSVSSPSETDEQFGFGALLAGLVLLGLGLLLGMRWLGL